MLHVWALLTGLLLSIVGGCIFQDFGKLNKATDIYGALFGSLELLLLQVIIIVCLYVYLMVFIPQEKKSLVREHSRMVGERWDVDLWWTADSRAVFFLAVPNGCHDVFRGRVNSIGDGPLDYGCMKSWLTLPIVALLALIAIHKSFHTAGWIGHELRRIPEPSSQDSSSEDFC
ncbi:unnamed protein product [Prorocentrum cordatum]|uniref:Uncharacterized protein n=1 Tax=Prorocentrum cordatum TaxID=2364126 RepID=A0ABN9XZ94_9DINO|nr:unnamed protein product [Polarella glacialis]